MGAPTPTRLLIEIQEIINSIPSRSDLRQLTDAGRQWLARAHSAVRVWGDPQGISDWHHSYHPVMRRSAISNHIDRLINVLERAEADLKLRVEQPLNSAIQQGDQFAFHNSIRRLMEKAQSDILFVDRYLDASFAEKYLPLVPDGVVVRLLTWEHVSRSRAVTALAQMVKTYATQYSMPIEVRTHTNIHDRYIFVDQSTVFQSGASFKDGPSNGEATIRQQEGQALHDLLKTYEALWPIAATVLKLP